jgi:hypothetical protein
VVAGWGVAERGEWDEYGDGEVQDGNSYIGWCSQFVAPSPGLAIALCHSISETISIFLWRFPVYSRYTSANPMPGALLAYDVSSIQHYVFTTGRLREIRGASAVLDEVNRRRLHDAALGVDRHLTKVYEGGGSGLYETSPEHIGGIEQSLHQVMEECTSNAVLHTAWVSLPDHDFPTSFRKLHARLRMAKMRNPEIIGGPAHAFLRTCEACGEQYASAREDGGDKRWVCVACGHKLRKSAQLMLENS